MLAKHYAPRTKTYLVDDVEKLVKDHMDQSIGVLSFREEFRGPNIKHNEILSISGDLKSAASNLYNSLHQLDQMKLDMIIAQKVPDKGLGKSINDRLERAAT